MSGEIRFFDNSPRNSAGDKDEPRCYIKEAVEATQEARQRVIEDAREESLVP